MMIKINICLLQMDLKFSLQKPVVQSYICTYAYAYNNNYNYVFATLVTLYIYSYIALELRCTNECP